MMHRIARVDVPVATVAAIFRDVSSWTRWMPDLTECRIAESGPDWHRAEACQLVMGQSWRQTIEVRLEAERVRVRTIRGGFLHWRADWTFRSPPDGAGTTVTLDLAMEAAFVGAASLRLFDGINNRRFDATLAAVKARAREISPPAASRAADVPAQSLLAVYETADGFEVWYEGRRYVTREIPVQG